MKNPAILFFLAALAALAISAGCSKEDASKKTEDAVKTPPTIVTTALPRRGEIKKTVEFSGTVLAATDCMITSKVPGRITKFYADEGGKVEAGKPLVQIDCSDLLIALKAAQGTYDSANSALARVKAGARDEEEAAAQASFDMAKSNLEYAAASFKRASELYNSSAISEDQFEAAKTAYSAAGAQFKIAEQQLKIAKTGATKEDLAIAQAGVKSASAALDAAKNQLDESVVTAPFAGFVVKKLASAGDLAAPGVPLLVLSDMKTVKIEFLVPEEYFGPVKEKAAVTVTTDAWPGDKRTGTVTAKNPYIDPMTRSFKVRVELQNSNKDMTLVPGMYAHVELVLEQRTKILMLPEKAVQEDVSGAYVFTLEPIKAPAGSNNAALSGNVFKAKKKTVKTGIASKDEIEIVSGLAENVEVIVEGNYGLADGQEVEVLREKKEIPKP